MFRINYSKLGLEEVKAAVLAGGGPVSAGELSDWLVGREICVQLDNESVEPPVLKYSFQSKDKLTLTENDNAPVECAYGALQLKGYILFAHMVPETLRGYTVILDACTGRAIVTEMWFIDYQGAEIDKSQPLAPAEISNMDFFINREVERQVYIGCFTEADRPATDKRVYHSLRLDNKIIKWDDDLGRKRIFTYISNYFSTMVELGTPDGEDVITFPCDYLQFDDRTFFYDVGGKRSPKSTASPGPTGTTRKARPAASGPTGPPGSPRLSWSLPTASSNPSRPAIVPAACAKWSSPPSDPDSSGGSPAAAYPLHVRKTSPSCGHCLFPPARSSKGKGNSSKALPAAAGFVEREGPFVEKPLRPGRRWANFAAEIENKTHKI